MHRIFASPPPVYPNFFAPSALEAPSVHSPHHPQAIAIPLDLMIKNKSGPRLKRTHSEDNESGWAQPHTKPYRVCKILPIFLSSMACVP